VSAGPSRGAGRGGNTGPGDGKGSRDAGRELACATLEIPRDHPAFAGHFPAFPVLPGALVLDETLEIIRRERGIDLGLWRISSAKFLGAVGPGERLIVKHDAPRDDAVRFTVRCGDRVVANGSLGAL
jgi:3-hydroxymyristoyl/3-hydroxydecanoyl-(acyl carrier protein) dehydratase